MTPKLLLKKRYAKFLAATDAEGFIFCALEEAGFEGYEPIAAAETGEDGQIHQLFRKELMKVGHYEGGEGSFDIIMEDLQNWVAVTKQMLANGVRIPVTGGQFPHEDVQNPENSLGTLEDAFIEGQSLFVILDIVGEENIETATANDVSIFSPVEFTDGKGRVYEQPITHIAITPNPLVPGLSGWEIAASLTAASRKESGMDWKKIAKALGLSVADLDEKTAGVAILAKIAENEKDNKAALKEAKKAAKKASLPELLADEDVAEAIKEEIAEQVAEKEKVIRASLVPDDQREEPKPMTVKLADKNQNLVLNGLVKASLITKKVHDKIKEKYCGKKIIAASLKDGDTGDHFDFLCECLEENDPVECLEKSGKQVIAASLNDPINDGEENTGRSALLADADKRSGK